MRYRLYLFCGFIIMLLILFSMDKGLADSANPDITGSISDNDQGNTTGKSTQLPQFHALGNSYWDGDNNYFVLTKPLVNQAGRIFMVNPYEMREWMAEFDIRVWGGGGLGGGADGMTFAFVRDYDYPQIIGGGLDFGGDGYGIEFNTYQLNNYGKPKEQHIGLMKGSINNKLTITPIAEGIRDNIWHHVKVAFSNGQITVYYDGREVISNYSIPDYKVFTGYFGFTAATAGGYEWHAVRNIRIAQKLEPIHDVMVSAVISPVEKFEPAKSIIPMAKIFNAGSYDEINVSVICEITSAGKVVYSSTQTVEKIASMKAQEVSFPEWTLQKDEQFEVKASVNLFGDANKDNDKLIHRARFITTADILDEYRKKERAIFDPYNQDRIAEATEIAERALKLAKETYGTEHICVGNALYDLAFYYREQGKYNESEILFKEALAIREKLLGDHPDVALILHHLGLLYRWLDRRIEAEIAHKRALMIREKIYGQNHPDVATSLCSLATIYHDTARFSEAETLYRRALEIWEQVYGPDNTNVSLSLNNLGLLYQMQGKYAEAEVQLQKALAIYEKKLGPDHFDVAMALNNLGLTYQFQGKYNEAEVLHKRALAIFEKASESIERNGGISGSLHFLGLLYLHQGSYAKAEQFYKRALEIELKLSGTEDCLSVATYLGNLSLIYIAQGKYSEAEPLISKVLATYEKFWGIEHPFLASGPLDTLGSFYQIQGKYAEAKHIYQRALTILEKAYGSEHPDIANSLENLAISDAALGDPKASLASMRSSIIIDDHTIENVFSLASEREKFTFLKTVSSRFDVLQSLVAQYLPTDPEAIRIALDATLRRKGLVLDALSRERMALLSSSDPKVSEIAKQLQDKASSISYMTLAGPGKLSPDIYKGNIEKLETEKEQLEEELASLSGVYAIERKNRQADTSLVANALEPSSALIEYVSYRKYNFLSRNPKDDWGEQRYLAFVLPAGQNANPVLIDLGDAKQINEAVHAFQQEAASAAVIIPNIGEKEAERELARKGKRVYELIFAPLKSAIGDRTVLFVSPDSDLNLISFGVLPDENGQYLVENYQFNYLSSGRDLLKFSQDSPTGKGVVVLANPDYNMSLAVNQQVASTPEPSNDNPLLSMETSVMRSTDFKQMFWYSLPGTSREAEAIIKEIPEQAQVYLKDQALEEVVKNLRSPRILHIATHAFFLNEQDKTAWFKGDEPTMNMTTDSSLVPPSNGRTEQKPIFSAPGIENPLLRSGLILAGANQIGKEKGVEDGILTSLEISGLSLWGTDLVVLSACETGLGETRCGEGVFGLRRAFQLAGARTVIMSQWNIPDDETVALMTDFYARLKAGSGKSQALREASLAQMKARRERNGSAHPFFWGGFVCVGNP